MIVRVRQWYDVRTLRERRLLLLMAAIALPLLVWLITIPVTRAYDAALEDHLEAVDRNGRVRALAETARALPGTTRETGGASLELIVAETAAQTGIMLQGSSTAGPRALQVQVSDASSTVVTQWLRVLDARGIQVDELRMTPGADRTITMSVRLVRRR